MFPLEVKDMFEVVIDEMRALTSTMFAATEHPWGYAKVGFCYPPDGK